VPVGHAKTLRGDLRAAATNDGDLNGAEGRCSSQRLNLSQNTGVGELKFGARQEPRRVFCFGFEV